jgi:hypothetical protein
MFDEYDEGTAIGPAAEDRSRIPQSQYFLTLDADGTRVSSDFYLRVAGAATKMIRGEAPQVQDVPVPPFVDGGGGNPPPPPPPPPDDAVPQQKAAADVPVQTFAQAEAQVAVGRLYRALLGRDADDSGLGAYTPLVAAGHLPRVATALATSGEFDARRGALTATGLANDLYQALLDRAPDPGGGAATADAIRQGNAAQRAVDMVLSPEYAAKNP